MEEMEGMEGMGWVEGSFCDGYTFDDDGPEDAFPFPDRHTDEHRRAADSVGLHTKQTDEGKVILKIFFFNPLAGIAIDGLILVVGGELQEKIVPGHLAADFWVDRE